MVCVALVCIHSTLFWSFLFPNYVSFDSLQYQGATPEMLWRVKQEHVVRLDINEAPASTAATCMGHTQAHLVKAGHDNESHLRWLVVACGFQDLWVTVFSLFPAIPAPDTGNRDIPPLVEGGSPGWRREGWAGGGRALSSVGPGCHGIPHA